MLRRTIEQARSFLGECVIAAYGTRGGARPNAGRKKNEDKIKQEHKEAIDKMLGTRKTLLAELHDPTIMALFKTALLECLQSKKSADRSWALRILTEVYLKLPVPKVAEDKEGGLSLEDLLKAYEDKIADGLLEGTEIDSAEGEEDNSLRSEDT